MTSYYMFTVVTLRTENNKQPFYRIGPIDESVSRKNN